MNPSTANPLHIQELVEYCIYFLHNSRPDLKRCALVCRAWTYCAQSHLFRNWTFLDYTAHQHLRIAQLDRLSRSPDILGLVVRLQVQLQYVSKAEFAALVPLFTRLQELRISGPSPPFSAPSLTAVRTLLSISTLQRAELYCTFYHLASFLQLWDGCSESIRHLALGRIMMTGPADTWDFPPLGRGSRIQLESLVVSYGSLSKRWLQSDACPFEFSGLTKLTLRIVEHTGTFKWGTLSGAFATIENLELAFISMRMDTTFNVDLSQFTRLRLLTLQSFDPDTTLNLLNTLSGVPLDNHITRIFIYPSSTSPTMLARLDSLLTSLPLSQLAGVKLGWMWSREVNTVAAAENCLPLLKARQSLSVVSAHAAER